MASYIRKEMAQLAHQLTMSPVRLRDAQLTGAEQLAAIIEPNKVYPYDFVCYRITAYHRTRGGAGANLRGKDLLADLSALVDDLSKASPRPASEATERLFTPRQLARKLNVSTKTISRWRARGLIGRRYTLADGKLGLAFSQQAVDRFVQGHPDLVRRAAAFRQLTSEERARIVDAARELLAMRRMKLHEVAQVLSARTGRAVETIRYTLRRHDQECPAEAVFAKDESPQISREHRNIFEAYVAGDNVRDIAKALGRPRSAITRIVNEMRARRIVDRPLGYMYSPEFDAPGAEQAILAEDACAAVVYSERRSTDGRANQAYFDDLSRLPLLTREQERDLFRQYNYLKFQAARLREDLEPLQPDRRLLSRIEGLLERAEKVQATLIGCNLRLVMNIAKRHVGNAPDLFEVVSDGNVSLMQAVEKFDYTRGNKFSTYATWAIMRNYARTIPEQRYRRRRFQTASEEMLESVPDHAACDVAAASERRSLREKIGAALESLDNREREVVRQHFGLTTTGRQKTLEEIGKTMGVTKERIRQIERRALLKLRDVLPESMLDLVSE
ncbi:MAG: sigma-70 family RNA polymerase sigma factor [Phycisphaerales bacterium]|nr:MAG: sigma-70 family RNA polymerase sigma factor [Phycisphaerales bacterium]